MTNPLQQSYEQTQYPDLAFAQTHPDRMATLASLLGLSPPPLAGCRVLELGSASGGNLIPMAYSLPDSQFVGLDFSASQITRGQTMIAALGLTNIELRQADILTVTPDWGQFDYIIAHGIYSWVPPQVRDKVLQICQQNLAPNGIAYVSYNAYPGWHLLAIVRDMMLFQTRHLDDPAEKAARAKATLDFMVRAVPVTDNSYSHLLAPYLTFLQSQLDRVGEKADGFLLHDELELINDAVYFHQFAEHAAQHGLQYLTETELSTVMPNRFPPQVMEEIGQWANDIIELEQTMDFARNRVFRQTLLCHEAIDLNRSINVNRLQSFQIASRAEPISAQPNFYDVSIEAFKGYEGATLSISHPVSKAAMAYLIETWPKLTPFKELLTIARERVAQYQRTVIAPENGGAAHKIAQDAQLLAANLLQAYSYSSQLVEFHSYRPAFVLQVSDKPIASPIARYQARSGLKVTNLYQESVKLDELNAYLIQSLDGQHDQLALLGQVMELVRTGKIDLKPQQPPLLNEEHIEAFMADQLEKQLRWLAKAALLVG